VNELTPKADGTTGEAKSRRALLIATLVAALALLGIFAMSRAGESLVYYWSPTELHAAGKQALGASIRLGGVVVPGSVQKSANGLDLRFRVSDGQGEVAVFAEAVPPPMFREGIGVVVEGTYGTDDVFHTRRLMVKHDNQYQPPKGASDEATPVDMKKMMQTVEEPPK
jgi:cytochrome c-type biogenesis protein CcmE